MPLSDPAAADRANQLLHIQTTVRGDFDPVRRYWKGRQRLPAVVPRSAPAEVREMARIARVNVCEIVVSSMVQSLIVDGFRIEQPEDPERDDSPMLDAPSPVWDTWQANKMDKRQGGIHAAAVAYGRSYAAVLPGRPKPVIRGVSPRSMTALYGDDPDWPVEALERRDGGAYVLYDDEAIYRLRTSTGGRLEFREQQTHPMGVTPVVRFSPEEDLDEDDEPAAENPIGHGHTLPIDVVMGQVAPLVNLQDQIDLITFNLLVAQHYTAFRQRWAIGWTGADEKKAAQTAASQLWAFKDHPDDIRLGEFSETNLEGYINSREASLKYAATLSQTPVHELIGQMINMAAEALAAAEAGRDRKVGLHKTGLGESHEQVFQLVGTLQRVEVPDDSQVVWRDTSARAFSAVVQGLGMLATQLGMPPQELWSRVPGFTQQDIRRMKAVAAEGDALTNLMGMLDRQVGSANGDGTGAGNGLILPAGVAA